MSAVTYDRLHHQFLISRAPANLIPGWRAYEHGGYVLMAHPSLPVNSVSDQNGNEMGYVLGWPIERSGKLIQDIRILCPFNAQSTEGLEKAIYDFGGRYAFVILAPAFKRLYPDPGATLSAVYSEKRGLAGSTVAALVLQEPDHPLWSIKLKDFPDNRPNQYWPAGTTLDPTIQRLLPNHYLDLVAWRAVRHYPKKEERIGEQDVTTSIKAITNLLQRHISAIAEHAPRVYMPLTAGRDSRALLACARGFTEKVEFVTFDFTPWRQMRSDRVDLYTSQSLAKRFRLRQRAIPIPAQLPAGVELEYLHRIGFAGGAGKSRDFFWSCQQYLDMSGAWLTGFGGEVGRAFYWRPSDKDTDRMSPAELLNRMALPTTDRLQDAMGAWLHSLPDLPLSTLLDFVYLEQRLGCWAAPHFYGAAPFAINLTPFNHREIYETMLRLPFDYRRSKALFHDLISTAWSELCHFPYNEYPGIRGLMGPSSRIGTLKATARSMVKRILLHR